MTKSEISKVLATLKSGATVSEVAASCSVPETMVVAVGKEYGSMAVGEDGRMYVPRGIGIQHARRVIRYYRP
jgi:hypothetical protein